MSELAGLLARLGVDSVQAQAIAETIDTQALEGADLDAVHYWLTEKRQFNPKDAVSDARIAWWLSPAVQPTYKRLLDAQSAAADADDLGVPIIVWDGAADQLVEEYKSLLPFYQATLQRAWGGAWRQWRRFAQHPDISPVLPVFPNLKSLLAFYEHVRPGSADPGHPAHVLRIFLEAMDASKAFDESRVRRHPAGTPVDRGTGVGGGRFAPKEKAGARSTLYVIEEHQQAGRLSVAVDAWPALPEDVEEALEAFADAHAFGSYETFLWYDGDGNLIIEKAGNFSEVVLDDQAPILGSVTIHNHPSLTAPFSQADAITSLYLGQRTARIVSGNYVWSLELPVFLDEADRLDEMNRCKMAWMGARTRMDKIILPILDRGSGADRREGSIDVATANHIGGVLQWKYFMEDYGEEAGYRLSRRPLHPEDALSPVERDALLLSMQSSPERREEQTVVGGKLVTGGEATDLFMKNDADTVLSRIGRKNEPTNFNRQMSIHHVAFSTYAGSGAKNLLTVGDTQYSRLRVKRDLTPAEVDQIAQAHRTEVAREKEQATKQGMLFGTASSVDAVVEERSEFVIPSAAWQTVVAQFPDLIDYSIGWLPGLDPVEMINDPRWDTKSTGGAWLSPKVKNASTARRRRRKGKR